MNRLLEAQKNYKRTGDKQALFETAYNAKIKFSEAIDYLKDSMGDNYSQKEYNAFVTKKYAELIKDRPSTNKLNDNFFKEGY